MKFIEVKAGYSVRKDCVIGIEDRIKDEISQAHETVLYMKNGGFISTEWPYATILAMLEAEVKDEIKTVKLEPKISRALESMGSFAG